MFIKITKKIYTDDNETKQNGLKTNVIEQIIL